MATRRTWTAEDNQRLIQILKDHNGDVRLYELAEQFGFSPSTMGTKVSVVARHYRIDLAPGLYNTLRPPGTPKPEVKHRASTLDKPKREKVRPDPSAPKRRVGRPRLPVEEKRHLKYASRKDAPATGEPISYRTPENKVRYICKCYGEDIGVTYLATAATTKVMAERSIYRTYKAVSKVLEVLTEQEHLAKNRAPRPTGRRFK